VTKIDKMQQQRFSVRKRAKSFSYAISGIRQFLRWEHNAWIHAVATAGVIITAAITGVSRLEAIALTIVTGGVWVTEMLNTCLERMADLISHETHPTIKFIKDLGAGAVLVASIAAVITGLYIFIPKII
jgi:diacylglycerol kinase (ATP)